MANKEGNGFSFVKKGREDSFSGTFFEKKPDVPFDRKEKRWRHLHLPEKS